MGAERPEGGLAFLLHAGYISDDHLPIDRDETGRIQQVRRDRSPPFADFELAGHLLKTSD